jgi:hypothetical protein
LATLVEIEVTTSVTLCGDSTYDIVENGFLSHQLGIDNIARASRTWVSTLTPMIYLAEGSGTSSPEALIGWDGERFAPSHINTLSSFAIQARRHLPDLTALAYFSTSDAISNGFQMLSSNYLENLASIGDLGGLVGAAKILMTMTKFRKLRSVPKLLSLLAEAKLVYSFGLAPTMSDASDISEKARSLMAEFLTMSRTKQSNGSAFWKDWNFPRSGLFDGLEISVHSKVVFRVAPDSFLSALIPLKSLGILPTLSNIWDLIPFSFVLDKFWRVGSAVESAENSFGMMFLDCVYIVHSVRTFYPLPEEVLINYGLMQSSESTRGGYVYYCRWVTKTFPVVSPTRFPVFKGSGIQDWSLASALAYKLVE